MANPRQRRKARSSSHRPISHSRHAKRNMKKVPAIRGPKALQEAWDKQKTVHQNYAKLGLTLNLNPLAHGGFERDTIQVEAQELPPRGFGRILRDDGGNITGFKIEEERPSAKIIDGEVLKGCTTLSVPISGIGSRYMSSGEMQYLGGLVKKYGDDVNGMSRDCKLNPEQRTVGELKRALRKFRL